MKEPEHLPDCVGSVGEYTTVNPSKVIDPVRAGDVLVLDSPYHSEPFVESPNDKRPHLSPVNIMAIEGI